MRVLFMTCLAAVIATSVGRAQDEGREVAEIDGQRQVGFQADILPFLRKSCLACHNKSETEGELILETVDSLLEGGDSGPALIPGNADESLIFQLATHRTEPIMPPVDNDVGARPLSAQALGLLRSWIDQGAKVDKPRVVDEIAWRKVPDNYAQVFALELAPDGRWMAAGRGNELVVYSVVGKREIQRLVDPAISSTHPDSAHLDVVQAVAWSPDQQTIVSGGYQCVKVWQRESKTLSDTTERTAADRGLLGDELGEVEHFVANSDQSRLVAIVNGDGGSSAKLLELPSRRVLREIQPMDFSQDHLSALDRELGVMKERLRVASADVDAAKQRKEEDEKAVEKSRNELKKANEDIPKRKEALKAAADDAGQKLAQVESAKAAIEDQKVRIEAVESRLESAKDEDKAQLNEEKAKRQDALKQLEDQLKNKQKEAMNAKENERKKRLELEGVEKVVELTTSAIARGEKAVQLRSEELMAAASAADDVEKTTKELEAHVTTDKKKTEQAGRRLVGVDLLGDDWRFGVRDDLGRVACFALDNGDYIGTHEPGDAGSGLLGKWTLVRTIGYPEDKDLFADRVTTIAFSNDGTMLATGGGEPSRSGEVHLWNTSDWSLIGAVVDAHSDVVYDLQFSPQDSTLASCGSDRMMKTIDPDAGTVLKNFEGHTGHVLGVSWRADGRTLATAGADKVVKVWDAKEGTQKKTVSGSKTEVTAVRFLGLEDRFVYSTGDGKVESRDSGGNGKPGFGGFADYVHRVTTSVDGKVVAAAGQDRVIRVWDDQGNLIVDFK